MLKQNNNHRHNEDGEAFTQVLVTDRQKFPQVASMDQAQEAMHLFESCRVYLDHHYLPATGIESHFDWEVRTWASALSLDVHAQAHIRKHLDSTNGWQEIAFAQHMVHKIKQKFAARHKAPTHNSDHKDV